jgi:hypothetical protein
MNIYENYFLQKGYSLYEVRQMTAVPDQRVPERLRDRYATYEEYRAAIHDFLNAN